MLVMYSLAFVPPIVNTSISHVAFLIYIWWTKTICLSHYFSRYYITVFQWTKKLKVNIRVFIEICHRLNITSIILFGAVLQWDNVVVLYCLAAKMLRPPYIIVKERWIGPSCRSSLCYIYIYIYYACSWIWRKLFYICMYNLVLNKEACNCSNNTKSIHLFSNKSLLGTACAMQNDIFLYSRLTIVVSHFNETGKFTFKWTLSIHCLRITARN